VDERTKKAGQIEYMQKRHSCHLEINLETRDEHDLRPSIFIMDLISEYGIGIHK